jgi:4a-hydroxytetrahydrobiopterin dehydratase
MSLTARSLESPHGEIPTLILAKAEPYLAELSDWEVDLEEGVLRRQFRFADFAGTIRFVNEIAKLAEAEDHPPDLEIRYDILDVTLSTPTVSGLTLQDFIVAAQIEKLPR